jgi:phosphatidylserine/phosphatidylglycerophosphate/cardiolipin synthase-like enzyme
MDRDRIDTIFARTLDDGRLSRAERRALAEVLAESIDRESQLDLVRSRAFVAARQALSRLAVGNVIDWLEETVKVIDGARPQRSPEQIIEAWFSPGNDCVDRLVSLLGSARRSLDICVFTITDDRLSRAILDAHHRSIQVRVITDDYKAGDLGSDICDLAESGVNVAVDCSPAHMHHKFALIDRSVVTTGSYNWTRSAAAENQENLIVSDQPRLVKRFADEFERLWKMYRGRASSARGSR